MQHRAFKLSKMSAAELSGMFNIHSQKNSAVGAMLVYSKLRNIKARTGDNGEDSRLPVLSFSTYDQKTNVTTTWEVFLSSNSTKSEEKPSR